MHIVTNEPYTPLIVKSQFDKFVPPNVIDSFRPERNGRYFADDIFKSIFLNENLRILVQNSVDNISEWQIVNVLMPLLIEIS